MTDLVSLIKIDERMVKPAAMTCAHAFENDPITIWMIPDEKKRGNLHYAFEMVLNVAVMGGAEAFTTSEKCEGVAIWMPAGAKQSLGMVLRAGYPGLPLRCGWRYFILDNRSLSQCEKLKKKYAPKRHCYLSALAVAPEYQGQGIASALLKPMLDKLDEDNTPCYVETQNLKNVAMYQHFGFKLLHETKMPGGNYPMYILLRQKN